MRIDTPARADYELAFAAECARAYPMIDALEISAGACLDRAKLERAAAVLACPVKMHAPHWQHGRVLYAITRRRLRELILAGDREPITLLDIGTAKGFSALCLLWALTDAGPPGGGHVISVDVIDPLARVRRNTIAELEGALSLAETLVPWPEARAITFLKSTGREWLLANHGTRVHVASVDGKHTFGEVRAELGAIARMQRAGDVIFIDDHQIEGVAKAIEDARSSALRPYNLSFWPVLPERAYAIARRES